MTTKMDKDQQERFYSIMNVKSTISSGYAGVNKNGNIVDRRFFPDAVPCLKNSMLGTPEPKDIRTIECIESLLGRKTTRQERLWWYVTRKDKDNYYVVHEDRVYSVEIGQTFNFK